MQPLIYRLGTPLYEYITSATRVEQTRAGWSAVVASAKCTAGFQEDFQNYLTRFSRGQHRCTHSCDMEADVVSASDRPVAAR